MFRNKNITLKEHLILLKNTFVELMNDNVFTHGAAIAYYALLSMTPILYFSIHIIQFFLGKERVKSFIEVLLVQNTGIKDFSAILGMIDSIEFDDSSIFLHLFGFIVLLFSSSAIFNAVKRSINTFYHIDNEGVERKKIIIGTIFTRLISISFVFGITTVLMLIYFTESMFFNYFGHWISKISNASEFVDSLINSLFSLFSNVLIFSFVFKYLNNAKVSWRLSIRGAIITSLLLFLGQILLKEYITKHFFAANIGGGIGSVFMFLVWVFYSSLIMFFGAKYIYEFSKILKTPIKRR